MRRITRWLVVPFPLMWLVASASIASAELTVIFDNGQTRSIAEFLGPLQPAPTDPDDPVADRPQLGAADIETLLPIRSPGLTPGRLESRLHTVPFARPFFMIGSDPWSRHWLVQHRQTLKDQGAVGLLVEATTVDDLRAMARLAEGLPMTPASGTDIATALGIDHYPVAISATRIWQ